VADERPPRRVPRPSAPDNLIDAFLAEWWEERRDGITTRSMHDMLKGHVQDDTAVHKDHGERIARIETNQERDAEDRFADATGRHVIPPPARTTKPPPKAWWSQEPFKSVLALVLTALATILLTELSHKLGLPAPTPTK
jgi:hypothetical protein